MKALFFDIDGTLLSEITKEIPQSALDALKKTAEKGNLTFINTGRTWSELPEELKKLPFSGFLCGCGTYLRRDGEILMHQTIPKKRCEEIPVILKECRIGMILVIYALSDFLIMILSWLVKQSLRAFLFQEVQP